MHRFVLLLFIFALGRPIYAAPSFQFPELIRRLPERNTSPGCAYKGLHYEHGESVPTAEPCLNCTCIRAVLVCYLRVCPTASAPPPGCFAAREVGDCCPTLLCGGEELSRLVNRSDSNVLRPTFQPTENNTTKDSFERDTTSPIYTTSSKINEEVPTTIVERNQSTLNATQLNTDELSQNQATTFEDDSAETDTYSTKLDPFSSENDSLVYITSTHQPNQDYNDIPAGGCMVNGTLYGDGSAMLSSTFCEYCFCIRGKSTCLKPKCQLTIEGCLPRYENPYTCCPSRYQCNDIPTSVGSDYITTVTSTFSQITKYSDDCIVDGTLYHQGELVPDRKSCHNCYCNDSSVVCEKIKCSLPLEGCQPIIPQGHCCPISYRCDYERGHLASNSIKRSNLNDSKVSGDSKGTDIKSVKNYFIYNNDKPSIERESVSMLHNFVPIERKLDETIHYEQNSTGIPINSESAIKISQGISSNIEKNITDNMDPIRENDKTLKLERNDSASALYPFELINEPFNRAVNSYDESSYIETVSVGPPIMHTLSIQELFDKFFVRQKTKVPKIPPETASESKRNNSKQPSSIVELYEHDGDSIESTTIKTAVIHSETSGTNNEDITVNNQTTDLATDFFTSKNEMLKTKNEIENNNPSSIFPFTKNENDSDTSLHTNTEPTHSILRSTSEKDQRVTDKDTKFFTTKNFDNQDSMGTHLFTTLPQLFDLKANTHFQTQPSLTFTNTYREKTSSVSPDYSATKAALIQEIKSSSNSQIRPVVFIYDATKYIHDGQLTTAHFIPSFHNTTTHSFTNRPKDYTDAYSTLLFNETTKPLYDDHSIEDSDSSPDVEDIYNILENQGEILPVSPVHITTNDRNDDDATQSPPPTKHFFDSTRHRNYGHVAETSLLPGFFTASTRNTHNYDPGESLPNSEQAGSTQNNIKYNLPNKQTTKPFITMMNTDFTNNGNQINPNTQSVFQTEMSRKENNQDFPNQTESQNIKYEWNRNQVKETFNTSQSSSTTEPITKIQNKDFSSDTVSLNTYSDVSTTETSQVSTRINSKLPSFNYVEKHINSSDSYYPVLSDTFIDTYAPAESRDGDSVNQKENFTNVGSIYLGAPLHVRGTDSDKDIADGKSKITHIDGVLFLDSKIADIDTKIDTESKETITKDTTSINIQETDKNLSNNERKKGPRNQDQSNTGQGFKIIPFVAEDAVRGQFGKLNETLVQPGVTEGVPDIVSDFCFIKGRIYMNGEMIGKGDPCELCRCFYGRELCQIQRCPTPPPDCVPDKIPGFCCPRFTCGNPKEEMKLIEGLALSSEIPTSITGKPEVKDRNLPNDDNQEVKYGIRVRVKSSPSAFPTTSKYATQTKMLLEKTTPKPEIRISSTKTSQKTTLSIMTNKPVMTTKILHTKKMTASTTTTTTTATPLFPDPWGLLKVSGCNIYGKFFNINDQVEILSGPCSHCICTINGVECNDIC